MPLRWTKKHPLVGKSARVLFPPLTPGTPATPTPEGVLPGAWCRVVQVGIDGAEVRALRVDHTGLVRRAGVVHDAKSDGTVLDIAEGS